MNEKGVLTVEGIVSENLPNTMFRVRLEQGDDPTMADQTILCTIAGRMRLNYVRLLPGDRVRCEINPLDKTRGRIIYKIK